MTRPSHAKDPYTWHFGATPRGRGYLDEGETITEHVFERAGDLTLVVGPDSRTTSAVTAWVTGGTDGQDTLVTCHVTTSTGRVGHLTVRFCTRDGSR